MSGRVSMARMIFGPGQQRGVAVTSRSQSVARAIGALVLSIVGATLATPTPTAQAADDWLPVNGPIFNNPRGSTVERYRIQRRLIDAINHTHKGAIIRMSLYSMDRVEVANALIAAKRRGVKVQILINDHQVTRAQKLLHRVLGSNPNHRFFIHECKHGCRAANENLHSKFYLFSKTGRADDVIFVGSANFTLNAVKWQWNDMFSIREQHRMFDQYVALFNDMRHDYSTNRPHYEFCGELPGESCDWKTDQFHTWVFPKVVGPGNDPVMDILDAVKCSWKDEDGHSRRTVLRLSMHTMRMTRGVYIAAKMRDLFAHGCDVKVLYGLGSGRVKRAFGRPTSRGKLPLRSSGFDLNDDGEVERYTHQKYLTIDGAWAGDPHAQITFTGSSNWTGRGTSGDEIIFSVRGGAYLRAWNANWRLMWDRYSRNAYTTSISQYRGGTGELRPGATWEND